VSISKVGIVILNYMTYELTIKCLASLNEIAYDNFFVVVVDNSSPNDSYAKIKDYINKNIFSYEIYLTKSERNGGYSYGNNIGVQKAEAIGADYVLIMNNDIIIPDKEFLSKITDFLDKNKDTAIAGPGIIQKKGMIELPLLISRIKPYNYIINNLFYPFVIFLNKIAKKRIQNLQTPLKVYAVSGCCFVIRTKIFNEIGYFDDNIFLYGEEYILGEKLYKRGYGVYFLPNLHIIHNHSVTIGSVYDSKKITRMQIKSHEYYLKHYRNDISYIMRSLMVYSDHFREKVYVPVIAIAKKMINIVKK